jgi:hypothetical protein
MASDALKRITALTRDESRLRGALARHRANRFDLEAARKVRRRVDELLETLTFIGGDTPFWDGLAEKAQVLEAEQIDALTWFDEAAFGSMLVASGYQSPPPPPIDELIAETHHMLALALNASGRPKLVMDARTSLLTFVYRTRRQIHVVDNTEVGPSSIEVVGRRVGQVARKVIPIAAGAAAGAIAESLLPGTGVGVAAGLGAKALVEKGLAKGVESVVETGVELATTAAIGYAMTDPPLPEVAMDLDEPTTPDQAIAAHLASAKTALTAFVADRFNRKLHEVRDVGRHLQRVIELSRDHGGLSDLDSGANLALDALDLVERQLAEPVRWSRAAGEAVDTEGALEIALEALAVCLAARGRPSAFSTPTYSEGPFNVRYDVDLDVHFGRQRRLSELWSYWRSALSPRSQTTEDDSGRSTGSFLGALARDGAEDDSTGQQQRYQS